MVDLFFDPDKLVTTPLPALPAAGERMHMLHESIFGRIGPALVRNGWSCFPQERGERRKSAVVDGRALKWKPYQERLPNASEIRSWSLQCPGENAAIITGPVSGNLFALDVDVDDPDLAAAVRATATEHLGHTPFYRFGRVPRVIMLYRHEDGVVMRKRSWRFGELDEKGAWKASDHAIEILANGSPFTAFGLHHKTGQYFKWGDEQPFLRKPTDVPIVTMAQIEAFLAAVQLVRPFVGRSTLQSGAHGTYSDSAPVPLDMSPHGVVPDASKLTGDWVVGENGRVTDGTHGYLRKLVGLVVRCNEHAFDTVIDEANGRYDLNDDGRHLVGWIRKTVSETVQGEGSRQELTGRVTAMVDDTVRRFNTHDERGSRRLSVIPTSRTASGRIMTSARLTTVFDRDPSLSWLGTRKASSGITATERDTGRGIRVLGVTEGTLEEAEARRLTADRTEVQAQVAAGVQAASAAFLADVVARRTRVHLDLHPTGAGKTVTNVRAIARLVAKERAEGRVNVVFDDDCEPVRAVHVVVQPTHNTLHESVRTATEAGLDFSEEPEAEGDLSALVEEAASLGLRAVHLRSKLVAGCLREEELRALMAAKLSTSGLCKSYLKDEAGELVRRDGKLVVQHCVHYGTCGAQRMMRALEQCDVVFATHHWLTASLPRSVKVARSLIVDESVVHQVLAMGVIPLKAFEDPRPWPSLTALEAKELRDRHGKVQDHHREAVLRGIVEDRDEAATLWRRAHEQRLDPIRLFADHRADGDSDENPRGLQLAEAGLRVARDAMTLGREATPSSSKGQILALAKRAKPAHIDLERHAFGILVDGVRVLLRERREGIDTAPKGPDPLPRDIRLQPVTDPDTQVRGWRVSWRRAMNWADAPTLLLDATGDVEVTQKLHPRREVVAHGGPVDPNLRVVLIPDRSYAPSSLFPALDQPKWKHEGAEKLRAKVQQIAGAMAGAHAHGQVLLASTKKAEEGFIRTWRKPDNVETAHYGDLRGRDRFKSFLAALLVGRTEQPIAVIDGLVAALVWDTEPEHPYDRLGTGLNARGKVLYRPRLGRKVRVRDGHDVILEVPCMPTDWGQRIEALWREAELQQAVGRLRGMYRPEPGVVVMMTNCPPEGMLIDDILTVEEAIGPHAEAWSVLGRADGVMVPGVTDKAVPGVTREQVEQLVAAQRHWQTWQHVKWTDAEGVERLGLVAAWQTDVRGTLERMGAPPELLAEIHVEPVQLELIPRQEHEPDKAGALFRDLWTIGPALEDWQVLHPQRQGEDDEAYLTRFRAAYDPAEFVVDPADEREAEDEPAG